MVIDARHRLATVRKLPYDAEIEYLEANGVAYIDTGIPVSTEYKIQAKFQLVAGTDSQDLAIFSFWNRYNTIESALRVGWRRNLNAIAMQCGTTTWMPFSSAITKNGVHICEAQNGICTIDEETVTSTPITRSDNTITQHLFGLSFRNDLTYSHETQDSSSKIRIWYAKWLLENKIVRDFIPVRIGTTGYMYDRANPKGGPLGNGLYPNQGSGDFILGKDVAYPKRKFEITYRKPFVSITPPLHYQGLHPRWTDRNVGRN